MPRDIGLPPLSRKQKELAVLNKAPPKYNVNAVCCHVAPLGSSVGGVDVIVRLCTRDDALLKDEGKLFFFAMATKVRERSDVDNMVRQAGILFLYKRFNVLSK